MKVMEECRKLAHPERSEDCDVEYGEYILYQIDLMIEAGQYQDAIDHSLRYESYVFDHVALLEGRGNCRSHWIMIVVMELVRKLFFNSKGKFTGQ